MGYSYRMSLLPFDKSWIIRMGILDLLHDSESIMYFLHDNVCLCGDLQSLYLALNQWRTGSQIIHVGESATLLRFLKYISWLYNLNKIFRISGSLANRKVCSDPNIINYPLKDLLNLDDGSSQWASIAVLSGNVGEKCPKNAPYKLKLSYEAKRKWNMFWEARIDKTIMRQALTYINMLDGRKVQFKPRQPEDYCFGRIMGFIDENECKEWSSLSNHESNRFVETEKTIKELEEVRMVTSSDPRIIMAAAMKQSLMNVPYDLKYPMKVNKCWNSHQFWKSMFNDWR